MTLKKAITDLINAEQGSVRLNSVAVLERRTKNALNEDVDVLAIRFDALNGLYVKTRTTVDIQARDYDGVIDECCTATQTFLSEAAGQIASDLKAGYWKEG